MEFKVVLFLPRDAASVPITRQVLDGCLETLGVTAGTRTDIALALTEACANVVLHAGAADEYEVMARASDDRCVIEVVNTGNGAAMMPPPSDPAPLTADHGRGLKIIDAVTDNMRLTGNGMTTVHFEKALEWVPGAPGEHLSHSDQGSGGDEVAPAEHRQRGGRSGQADPDHDHRRGGAERLHGHQPDVRERRQPGQPAWCPEQRADHLP